MTNKDKFAVLYAQEAMFYDVCVEIEWPYPLNKEYLKFTAKVRKFGEEIFPKRITIQGYCPGLSHYIIDDKVKEKFDEVQCDSESDQFYCYAPEDISKEVFDWITKNFSWDEISMLKNEHDKFQNPFVNWADAREYCKKNGLLVQNPVPGSILLQIEKIKEAEIEFEKTKKVLMAQLESEVIKSF